MVIRTKKSQKFLLFGSLMLCILFSVLIHASLIKSPGFIENVIEIEPSLEEKHIIFADKFEEGLIYGTFDNTVRLYLVPPTGETHREIYNSKTNVIMTQMKSLGNSVIILEIVNKNMLSSKGDGMYFILKEISPDHEKILYEDFCERMPYLYNSKENILLNYNIYGKSNLLRINPSTDMIDTIASASYRFSSDGKYTGQVVVYAGGTEEVIYYQLLEPNNEYLEECEKYYILKYSLQDDDILGKYTIDNKSMHITGTNHFLITSEYAYEYPIEDSGKVYSIQNNEIIERYLIENIRSGVDIIDSTILSDDAIMFLTPQYGYIYSYSKDRLYKKDFSSIRESSNYISLQNDKFVYWKHHENRTTFHFIEWRNTMLSKKIISLTIVFLVILAGFALFRNNKKDIQVNFQNPISKDERLFIVEEEPKNNYEITVCNYYLAEITGEFDHWNELIDKELFTDLKILIENSKNIYQQDKGFKEIVIKKLETYNADEAKQDLDLETVMFHSGIGFEEFTSKNMIKDYSIVKVQGNITYMDNYYPQYPSGDFTEYLIIGTGRRAKIMAISNR